MRQKIESTVEYFEELSETTQEIVKDLVFDTIEQVEGWKYGREDILENVECKPRDGFSPYSHNRGGITARQFTDLMSLWGSGTQVSHVKAQAEIDRQVEYSLKMAKESFFEKNKEALKELGIDSDTHEKLNYHDLYEMKQGDLAESLSEYETESMTDDSSSIMFEVRFMYHGQDDSGNHSASISCAVNTEGPYHRSSISWAPGVFCEGANEVEISWRTEKQLKTELTKALKKTSDEVF